MSPTAPRTIDTTRCAAYKRSPQEAFRVPVRDDWTMNERLTLNLGLRYDIGKGMFGEQQRRRS